MSTPASAMTLTASGLRPGISTPANQHLTASRLKWFVHPSAIWFATRISTDKNKIFSRLSIIPTLDITKSELNQEDVKIALAVKVQ
jgi:hypothetical protein